MRMFVWPIAAAAVMLAAAPGHAQVPIFDGYTTAFDDRFTFFEYFGAPGSFRLEIVDSPARIASAAAEALLEGDKYQYNPEDDTWYVDNNVRDATGCGVTAATPFCRFTEYKLQGDGEARYVKQQLLQLDGTLLRGSFRVVIPPPNPRLEDIIDIYAPMGFDLIGLVEGAEPVRYRIYAGTGLSGFSVPEPASWALMIGGFGLTGGALRRRRAIA